MKNKEQLFPSIDHYKVELEKKNLVRQNIFVLSLIYIIGILSVVYLIIIHEDVRIIIGFGTGFLVIVMFNIASLSYGDTQIEFLKFNKFITSISFFTLMIIYVLYFKSPAFLPFLFLAYLIAAVYKDIKVLTIISLYFILTMSMLLINYNHLFYFQYNPATNNLVIVIFVILFLSILMISTYITIKESQFFYNQISYSKEKECRNIEFLIDLKSKVETEFYFQPNFFEKIQKLFKVFSEKAHIHNVFDEKIEILKMLSEGKSKEEVLKTFPDFTVKDVHRLETLLIKQDALLKKIAMHVFYFNQRDIHQREMFSETNFESFNKSVDDLDTKIVSFAVFYALLKKGLPGTKGLSKEEAYELLIHSDFYYLLPVKVREIYQENPEVFETIINDVFDEVVS